MAPTTELKPLNKTNLTTKRKLTTMSVVHSDDHYSYFFKVVPVNSPEFVIPVIDVRDGPKQREIAASMVRNNNKSRGSKYMKQTFTGLLGETYN